MPGWLEEFVSYEAILFSLPSESRDSKSQESGNDSRDAQRLRRACLFAGCLRYIGEILRVLAQLVGRERRFRKARNISCGRACKSANLVDARNQVGNFHQ